MLVATDIRWDYGECEEVILPTEIEIPEGIEGLEDISDYISNVTGFCHFGFRVDKV